MDRCAHPIVFASNIHSLFFEEEERYWLVTLGSNMHHIYAVVVFRLHVSSIG